VKFRVLAALACVAILSACAFENKYESEADKITKAVIANDISPVKDDISPQLLSTITRVKVAALSDELSSQGKLESVKEVTPCDKIGVHCFDVTFEKHKYREWLAMDDTGKVTYFWVHMAQ